MPAGMSSTFLHVAAESLTGRSHLLILRFMKLRIDRPEFVRYRESAGYNRDYKFAKAVDMFPEHLSKLLNSNDISNVSTGRLWRITDVLDCNLEDIVTCE